MRRGSDLMLAADNETAEGLTDQLVESHRSFK
jgi:hypothetical protein